MAEHVPWYVCRVIDAEGASADRGFPDLVSAAQIALAMVTGGRAQRFVIFAGQPSDGARLVMRYDPEGLPPV